MIDPRRSLALKMGDSALILAQQNSKWCGHTPTLEEDIAFANVSLDLMGHAQMWLNFVASLDGNGQTADKLAFLRDAIDFRNSLLCERPNTDFAVTLVRQYFFDVWHLEQLKHLKAGTDATIAEISTKALVEVEYHRERSRNLVIKLGYGTEESHTKIQLAIDSLWPYFGNLFEDSDWDRGLFDAGISPLPSSLRETILRTISNDCKLASLNVPDNSFFHKGANIGHHTEELGFILAEMQYLQRSFPNCEW